MTEIAFHFNAPDKLAYACRFARKAQRAGARLVIHGAQDAVVSHTFSVAAAEAQVQARLDPSAAYATQRPVTKAAKDRARWERDISVVMLRETQSNP